MAVIDTASHVRDLYQADGPHRLRLCAVYGVNTGDTLDVGDRFSKLQTAIASSVTSASNGLPSISGTVVTFGQAGLSNDTVVLLLVGGWV